MENVVLFIRKHFLILNLFFVESSHSDTSLEELGKDAIKEDDRAILLESGLTRSASAKFHPSSVKLNLIRSFSMIRNFMWFFLFSTFIFKDPYHFTCHV